MLYRFSVSLHISTINLGNMLSVAYYFTASAPLHTPYSTVLLLFHHCNCMWLMLHVANWCNTLSCRPSLLCIVVENAEYIGIWLPKRAANSKSFTIAIRIMQALKLSRMDDRTNIRPHIAHSQSLPADTQIHCCMCMRVCYCRCLVIKGRAAGVRVCCEICWNTSILLGMILLPYIIFDFLPLSLLGHFIVIVLFFQSFSGWLCLSARFLCCL